MAAAQHSGTSFYRDRVHANPFGEQILARIMLSWWAP
jgi:hypothetical protein